MRKMPSPIPEAWKLYQNLYTRKLSLALLSTLNERFDKLYANSQNIPLLKRLYFLALHSRINVCDNALTQSPLMTNRPADVSENNHLIAQMVQPEQFQFEQMLTDNVAAIDRYLKAHTQYHQYAAQGKSAKSKDKKAAEVELNTARDALPEVVQTALETVALFYGYKNLQEFERDRRANDNSNGHIFTDPNTSYKSLLYDVCETAKRYYQYSAPSQVARRQADSEANRQYQIHEDKQNGLLMQHHARQAEFAPPAPRSAIPSRSPSPTQAATLSATSAPNSPRDQTSATPFLASPRSTDSSPTQSASTSPTASPLNSPRSQFGRLPSAPPQAQSTQPSAQPVTSVSSTTSSQSQGSPSITPLSSPPNSPRSLESSSHSVSSTPPSSPRSATTQDAAKQHILPDKEQLERDATLKGFNNNLKLIHERLEAQAAQQRKLYRPQYEQLPPNSDETILEPVDLERTQQLADTTDNPNSRDGYRIRESSPERTSGQSSNQSSAARTPAPTQPSSVSPEPKGPKTLPTVPRLRLVDTSSTAANTTATSTNSTSTPNTPNTASPPAGSVAARVAGFNAANADKAAAASPRKTATPVSGTVSPNSPYKK